MRVLLYLKLILLFVQPYSVKANTKCRYTATTSNILKELDQIRITDRDLVAAIRADTQTLLDEFPVDKNRVFIFWGENAQLDSAMINAVAQDASTVDLPIRNFKRVLTGHNANKNELEMALKRFFPMDKYQGKSIVITRNLFHSDTVELFIPELIKYLDRNGFTGEVVLNFTASNSKKDVFTDEFILMLTEEAMENYPNINVKKRFHFREDRVQDRLMNVRGSENVSSWPASFRKFKYMRMKDYISNKAFEPYNKFDDEMDKLRAILEI